MVLLFIKRTNTHTHDTRVSIEKIIFLSAFLNKFRTKKPTGTFTRKTKLFRHTKRATNNTKLASFKGRGHHHRFPLTDGKGPVIIYRLAMGGRRILGWIYWFLGEQKGGTLVTENPKGEITENFGRIQRGDHSNLLGKWRHRGEGDRESHQKLLGGITSAK